MKAKLIKEAFTLKGPSKEDIENALKNGEVQYEDSDIKIFLMNSSDTGLGDYVIWNKIKEKIVGEFTFREDTDIVTVIIGHSVVLTSEYGAAAYDINTGKELECKEAILEPEI